MAPNDLRISKLTPAIGAEIAGIDLDAELDAVTLDTIYQALIDHLVIFFRGQDLSPARHLSFARSFGEPEPPHPVYPHVDEFENIMVLANDANTPPDTDGWHADVTYKPNPPFASILCAREVPECGGDTTWANMYAAYEALPDGMKADLAGLTAVHDMGDFRNNFATGPKAGERVMGAHQRFGSAVHPVVMHHPVTGRPFLYVNEGFTPTYRGPDGAPEPAVADLSDRPYEPAGTPGAVPLAEGLGGHVGQPGDPALCRCRLSAGLSLHAQGHRGQRRPRRSDCRSGKISLTSSAERALCTTAGSAKAIL